MKESRKLAGALVLAFVACFGGGAYYYLNQYRPIQAARTLVVERLSDPQSAQFRNEVIYGGTIVCGEVNARNRMGGYVGFRWFNVALDTTIGKPIVSVDDTVVDVNRSLCDKLANPSL